MFKKCKKMAASKKILFSLIPLPFIFILLASVIIFLKDMWWVMEFERNFNELIKNNFNWKFVAMIIIQLIPIYILYTYFIFFRISKKNKVAKDKIEKDKT